MKTTLRPAVPGPTAKTVRPKRHRLRRVLIWTAATLVTLAVLGAMVLFTMYGNTQIPTAPPLIQTSYVYDRNGRLITTIHSAVDRTVVPFSDMPTVLREAVIATEDRTFYSNPGIDLGAIARAAWEDVSHGTIVQGGSTITQQYVKNVYTGDQVTFGRKFHEALLALKLDRTLTKDQILARYLNTIYFGHGAYGVQAAAETYWNEPAKDLTLAQAATLAGVIAEPSAADPIAHPLVARQRRDDTLQLMVQQGYISAQVAQRVSATRVATSPAKPATDYPGAYFVDYVRSQLDAQYGPSTVAGGGLRVTTTLDLSWQKAAEDAVRRALPSPHDPQAALVAIDPRSGAIRAFVGGRDYATSQVDNAAGDCQGCVGRQAGSAFKPFTLAAALDAGVSPLSVWHGPPSITIRSPQCGAPWHVSNYADESAGTMDLMHATADSVNTIFAQVVAKVGPQAVVDEAHSMGITSKLQPVCSITLGSQSVTPLEMASAFGTIADGGMHFSPMAFTQVKSPGGQVLNTVQPQSAPGLAAPTAGLVSYALQGVVRYGTGVAAQLGNRPVAGKTGTAENFTNAWFCGFVPQLVTCVWVGYPKANIPLYNVEGVPAVYGGSIPAEIWHSFMQTVTKGMPIEPLPSSDLSQYPRGPLGSPSPAPASPAPAGGQVPAPSPLASPEPPPSPRPSPRPRPSSSPSPSFALP